MWIKTKIQKKIYDEFCEFIFEVWANSNMEYFEYIMNWFAYRLQKLNCKPQIALLIISKEGCGKNIVTDIFTKYIIGEKHSLSNLADARKITGNFNSIIEDKLLIVANEFTSEAKQYFINTNILKSNITDNETVVEGKFTNCKVIRLLCIHIFN